METIIDRTAPATSLYVHEVPLSANGRRARVYMFDGPDAVRTFEGTLSRGIDPAYRRSPHPYWWLSIPDVTGRFPTVGVNLRYMAYARVELLDD